MSSTSDQPRRSRRALAVADWVRTCLWLAAWGWCGAIAAAEPVAISDITIGFNGELKVGRWTPVSFRIQGTSGDTIDPAIIAPDPDGSDTTWKLPQVTLDAEGRGQTAGLFKIGRLEGVLRVTAGDASASISAASDAPTGDPHCAPRAQNMPFVAVLGSAPGLLPTPDDAAADTAPNTEDSLQGQVIAIAEVGQLPTTAAAYDAIDVVVLSQQFDLDAVRSAALSEWVRHGGHVVAILGGDPRAFSASPLAGWMPLQVHGTERFRELAALRDRVPRSPPLNVAEGIDGVRIESPEGLVLASSLSAPLLIRAPYGLGRCTVLAVDVTNPRLRDWSGLPGLYRFLTDIQPPTLTALADDRVQLRPTGVSELATQLASQLDHFRTVQRPSYWTVILFAAGFLLLVGPLDYLLVHKVLKQPRLTWFTFPAWIIFAAAAASMGADRMNSTERQVNQFDLVDLDVATGLQQVQSWMTPYSPTPQRMQVAAQTAAWLSGGSAAPMRLSWSGTPETGFGGMYRSGGLNLANPRYTMDVNAAGTENMPIDQWSSKALTADWDSGAEKVAGEPLVISELVDDGAGLLKGTFTHHLPGGITEWCVAYGTGMYFPSDREQVGPTPKIEPGVPWSSEDGVTRRLPASYLQGLRQTYNSSSLRDNSGSSTMTTVAYDPLGLDPFPLARIVTFYDVADGPHYTGLENHSLGRSDFSRLLPFKRAVLFGRISSAAAEYKIDGADVQPQERWTFIRIVLPVKPGTPPNLRDTDVQKIR
ncbi:MAG: hypothetical protein U0992_09825 [Planctomycetaceae bacterium]